MSNPSTKNHIEALFSQIAPQYDLFNHLSSLGLDSFWRDKTLEFVRPGMRILDVGTGTGDLAIAASKLMEGKGDVVGLDFSQAMLDFARSKEAKETPPTNIQWIQESAENIPFDQTPYDAVISGFVLRNLYQHIVPILEGIHQCLKPGGQISFIDLTEPENLFVRIGSKAYFTSAVSIFGYWCFRDSYPVKYLKNSVQQFFRSKQFVEILKKVGFVDVKAKSYLLGVVTHYSGYRP